MISRASPGLGQDGKSRGRQQAKAPANVSPQFPGFPRGQVYLDDALRQPFVAGNGKDWCQVLVLQGAGEGFVAKPWASAVAISPAGLFDSSFLPMAVVWKKEVAQKMPILPVYLRGFTYPTQELISIERITLSAEPGCTPLELKQSPRKPSRLAGFLE